jgi:hypothetical protein
LGGHVRNSSFSSFLVSQPDNLDKADQMASSFLASSYVSQSIVEKLKITEAVTSSGSTFNKVCVHAKFVSPAGRFAVFDGIQLLNR